jgi:hypothetical protein
MHIFLLPYVVLTLRIIESIQEVPTMNRAVIVVVTLSLTFPLAGMAQSSSQTASAGMPISVHDAHRLMKTAHTSTDYTQLAAYFHQRETEYRAKAAAEKVERDRRAQVNAGLYQKYPRPVDSAQYLYESYLSEAESAAVQAQHYDQLVGASPSNSPQVGKS